MSDEATIVGSDYRITRVENGLKVEVLDDAAEPLVLGAELLASLGLSLTRPEQRLESALPMLRVSLKQLDGIIASIRGDAKRVKETLHHLRSVRSKLARQVGKGTPPAGAQHDLPFEA